LLGALADLDLDDTVAPLPSQQSSTVEVPEFKTNTQNGKIVYIYNKTLVVGGGEVVVVVFVVVIMIVCCAVVVLNLE